MGVRRPTEERRDEVVRATLDLLADLPLERITTRLIADRVGVTQPALFRHFASRDALILAAIEHTQAALGDVAFGALDANQAPLDRAEALVLGILAYVRENPGVPRLLFRDAADDEAGFREPLQRLMQAQRAVFAGFVRDARLDVDSKRAGHLLVALVQGVVLQWQLGGREGDLMADGRAALALWRAGLAAGQPALPEVAPAFQEETMIALDVRPLLADGQEPLGDILAAVDRLGPGGVLKVTAPFRPVPLERLLGGRGLQVEVVEHAEDHWDLLARRP